MRDTLGTRFWKKVAAPDSAGCWNWTAFLDTDGYGHIRLGGRGTPQRPAHRVAWQLFNGPVPEGLLICHKCDNPRCVNPSHLFLGTHADNLQDMTDKGRRVAWHTLQTRCKYGHPFSGDNLRVGANGRRVCITCEKSYHAERYINNRTAMLAQMKQHRQKNRDATNARRRQRRNALKLQAPE